MKYAIVYSSKTGNTRLLAESLQKCLKEEDCVYYGSPSREALTAERIYIGFWTNQGTCDLLTKDFLKELTTQQVFLFGTAGFGVSEAYYEQIAERVTKQLPSSVKLMGSYMCQGKMPGSVRQKYESMKKLPGMKNKMEQMIQNFDLALAHPNEQDLENLKKAVLE